MVIRSCLFALAVALMHGTARADLISGSLEWYTQNGNSQTTDATGLTVNAKSRYFLQRYNLYFDSQMYPQVNLRAAMRVEKEAANSESGGTSFKATRTLLFPSIGLTLTNPLVTAGMSFDRRDEKIEVGGMATTTIRDTRNAFLGLRPVGLPTLDLMYVGTSWYDKDHTKIDRDENMYQLSLMYLPVRSLQLNYSANYDELQDHLTLADTKSLIQNARVAYNDRFFDDRWLIGATYNITHQDVEFTRQGTGNVVRVQLFPLAGLSSINDTPLQGALDPNPALIDGNLTVSSGINIGQLPSQTGDVRRRNVGHDFGITTTVSTLYVWVDRPLPAVVANSFSWEIYTSPDNLNWFLAQTVAPANFGLFDNRFEISFPAVSARYVKVVTRPLSVAVIPPPGFDVSNIFITEVQAFFDQPVVTAPGTSSTTVVNSQTMNLNSRFSIIRSERHSLLYDLYYNGSTFDSTGQPSSSQSTLSNALIAYERFSRIFSGSAKVMLQNDEYANKTSETYTDAEASLMAAGSSLPKLGHTFTLTGKRETWDLRDQTKRTGNASLSNTATIYPGINGYLGLIRNLVSTETATATLRTDDTQFNFGADIIPHPALTLNVNYSWIGSQLEGSTGAGGLGTTSRRTKSTFASAAYNPFSSLYLYGTVQRIEETGKETISSYSFSGSMSTNITGGALEIRLIYSENSETEARTTTRSYGPYARYRMSIRASLEMSYLIGMTDSPSSRQDSQTFNTTFKLFF